MAFRFPCFPTLLQNNGNNVNNVLKSTQNLNEYNGACAGRLSGGTWKATDLTDPGLTNWPHDDDSMGQSNPVSFFFMGGGGTPGFLQ